PVTVTSSGSDVDELVSSFELLVNGETVGSTVDPVDGTADDYDSSVTETAACAGTSCTIVFDDLDLDIDEGSTVTFEVRTTINEIDGVTLTNGDSLLAKVTSTGAEAVDGTADGDDLTATELSGSAVGEAQHFFEVYADVHLTSKSNVAVIDNADVSTITYVLTIKAVGGDIYVNGDNETTAADEGFILSTLGGDGNSTLAAVTHLTSGTYTITNTGADNEYYTIYEGDTMTVTLSSTITQVTTTANVGAEIDNIQFGIVATDQTTRSALDLNWADFTDQFDTALITLVP
ncbi:hypothetical protein KKA39_00480, partial [Patescibacteria group bacterium]|nr:hypothetical protein [Patescibacteria group bacterium]